MSLAMNVGRRFGAGEARYEPNEPVASSARLPWHEQYTVKDGSAQTRRGVSLKSRWHAARAGMAHAMKVRRWLGAGKARHEPREQVASSARLP